MDDNQKQRVMMAVLAFNFVIIAYQIFFNWQFSFLKFLLGALIAGACAALAYFATQMSQK